MWKQPSPFPVGNYTPSTLLPTWAAPSLKCQLPVYVSTRKHTSCSLIFYVKEQIETFFLFFRLGRIKKENLGEQENDKEQHKSRCNWRHCPSRQTVLLLNVSFFFSFFFPPYNLITLYLSFSYIILETCLTMCMCYSACRIRCSITRVCSYWAKTFTVN